MTTLSPLACLLLSALVSSSAHARQAPPAATGADAQPAPAVPKAGEKLQQVTVSGERPNEIQTRRHATAAKMIFGREELDRNGDSNVGEILKRLPGVTMGGPPGRGGRSGGARMRGLGNGYTQMLVNGERPPAGFSIESLAPDQVERIEIMRGPVAEHSTQAIAGTINIVLREGYQQKDIQLKLADSIEDGLHSPNVSLSMPGKRGKLTWLLTGSASLNRGRDMSEALYTDYDGQGVLLREQTIAGRDSRTTRSLHLMPRMTYRFDNGDTLNFQPMLVSNRSQGDSNSVLTQRLPVPTTTPGLFSTPEYAVSLGQSTTNGTFMRAFGNWLHRMPEGARLDVKFGFGGGRSRSETQRTEYSATGAQTALLLDSDRARQNGISYGGKYTKSLAKGHLLAAGWDLEATRRTQSTVALVNGAAQFGASGDSFEADSRRAAMFIQDEWDITPKWGVYLGLRWEGIRTNADNANRHTESSTSVWSPVLHSVWRLPGSEKDQIRASYTQSYRAPPLNDLIAAPVFSRQNSATRPDRIGNPDLKPELAQGLDLAYEHYIGKNGIVSASGFVRQIDNLMRRELSTYTDAGGVQRFLSSPSNIGSARTSGIELEAKLQLADLMRGAPNVPNMDLRANYSRFWSSVDGIPGPDNRLEQQAPYTANLGADYRFKKMPLTLGGSMNWTPATVVQTSLTERTSAGLKRQLDAYGLWKFRSGTQVRVGAANIHADDYLNGRLVEGDNRIVLADTRSRTFTVWTARLEMKL
ncbi:TonB-dependent receptor [Massilia sp. PAMC28688]|uniref:TonB-dependent receptor plug domain-containing protein n=1 Tax=Massilia sp. PAMC28688 TaxID=2861283 RepID=UPI001C6361F8|nr:TonB-dependent receptor [Massilia sp. PAMC28688]QYF95085.1 TonB-dependent receptor [Massilia sp. PAMC28688]